MAETGQIFFHNGRKYARDSACSPAYYRDNGREIYDRTLGIPEGCSAPQVASFDPSQARSFKITDAQKNITIRFERRPFKESGRPPFSSDNFFKYLFKNSYEEHFGWRRAEDMLFKDNFVVALRNVYDKLGPVGLWLKKNPTGQQYAMLAKDANILRIIRSKGEIDEDSRLQSLYKAYGQNFYEELCSQVSSMKWRLDDLFEGPKYLMRLAKAHLNAAVFSLGNVALEITQIGIDKLNLTAKLRAKLYPIANSAVRDLGVGEVNVAIERISEVASDLMDGTEFDTNLGKMAVNAVVDKPYEEVINFSKDEITNMIMDYQTRHKKNPDLSVQDPISNPLFEKVIGLYGPAALAYSVSKGVGNTLLHSIEAHQLKKEAKEHIQFLVDEDARGLKQGRGYTYEMNVRIQDILKDLNALNPFHGNFLSYLSVFNQKFFNDYRREIELWISTPTGQTFSEISDRLDEQGEKEMRKIRIEQEGRFSVEAEEDLAFVKSEVSEYVGRGVEYLSEGLESIGGSLDSLADDWDDLWKKK